MSKCGDVKIILKCNFPNSSYRMKLMSTTCKIALMWMPEDTFDEKSILVPIMAWYRQVTSHYPSPGWCKSLSHQMAWLNRNELKPLTCGNRLNFVQISKYHGCWCSGACLTTLNQRQCSVQMKATLPLANRIATASDRSVRKGPGSLRR